MTNKEKNIQRINRIFLDCSELNWNGYDALPMSKIIIDRALILINEMPEEYQPEFIAPTARDSIQIEYENDNCYLEFEIYKNHFKGYVSTLNSTNENLLAFTTNDVLDYVKKYYFNQNKKD